MSRHILTAVAWPMPTARGTSGTSPASASPPTCSAGTAGWRATRSSWSAAPRARTPIQRRMADAEGVSAPGSRRPLYNRVIVEELPGRLSTTCSPGPPTAQPPRRPCRSCSAPCTANGYSHRVRLSAISPSTGRTLPGPLHRGTCPICGYGSARGDQCDNCGNQLGPGRPRSTRSARSTARTPVSWKTETSSWTAGVRRWRWGRGLQSRQGVGAWRPNVLKFSQNLLGDLQPRGITRDLEWGVPIPLEGWQGPTGQAHLRLVRRGHRLPVSLRGVGEAQR
jgi:methionyl-tRNA synthetase